MTDTMSMTTNTILHCDGCDETFEASVRLIGALCSKGHVRLANELEVAEFLSDDPVCTCDSWPMPFPCEVH